MIIDYQYFEPLLEKISYMCKADQEDVRKAYAMAYEGHDGQTRSSGLPYITHPVAVAGILADIKLDKESIQAAVLHDVIEDTKFGSNDIRAAFGDEVTHIVEGVTKLDKLKFRTRQEAEVANFRKMILAMTKDVRVVLIKLADRTHNMRTLGALRPDKQRRIAQETLDIYSTLAYRLGLMNVRLELDQLSFRAIHPLRYNLLEQAKQKATKHNKSTLEKIHKEIEDNIAKLGIKATVRTEAVPLLNIYRRMQRKSQKFHSILDVYRFIVLTDSPDECYRALGVIHSMYKPVPGTFQDFIALPKINGYQSLHTELVTNSGEPLEVFIRSRHMNEIADLGIATCLTYTPNYKNILGQQRISDWLDSLAEVQNSSVNSIEFNNRVKAEIAPEDIFCFTPRGKIIELPINSTALDFAYYIHSNIGIHALSCEIDGQVKPLSTKVKSGQTIKIITSPDSYPVAEDLAYVNSSRAKARMKQAIKDKKLEQYTQEGCNTIERLYGKPFASLNKEAVRKALTFFNLENEQELFVEICLGNIISPIVKEVIDSYASGEPHPNIMQDLQRGTYETKLTYADLIKAGHKVRISPDSYIVPHDEIYISHDHGKGLLVHHRSSKHIQSQQLTPYQHIRLQWGLDRVDSVVKVIFTCAHSEGLNRTCAQLTEALNNFHAHCFRSLDFSRCQLVEDQAQVVMELALSSVAELEAIDQHFQEIFPYYQGYRRIYLR